MTILAQQWLEYHKPSKDETHDFMLELCLDPKWKSDKSDAANVDLIAERIVFNDDLTSMYDDMVKNDQITTKMILRNVRMPATTVWVEWRTTLDMQYRSGGDVEHMKGRVGVLFVKAAEAVDAIDEMGDVFDATRSRPPESVVNFTVVAAVDGREAFIIGYGSIAEMPLTTDDTGIQLGSELYDAKDEGPRRALAGVLIDAMFGMFLLQQPKLIERVHVDQPSKLQKARVKRGKIPLLEYHRVNILIGGVSKRYVRGSVQTEHEDAPLGRKKYHRVLGHFRERAYKPGELKPHWISPHFRGDPAKGVVLHERDVTIKRNEEIAR